MNKSNTHGNPPNPRAILYVRAASSDTNDWAKAVSVQQQELETFCKKKNIEIIVVYREHGTGGTCAQEFQRLLDFLKNDGSKVNLLLITRRDRLTRDFGKYQVMMQQLKEQSVKVIAIQQPLEPGQSIEMSSSWEKPALMDFIANVN